MRPELHHSMYLLNYLGKYDVSKLLIENGADIEIKDKGTLRTPLLRAACSNGADVNAKDSNGWTPLL